MNKADVCSAIGVLILLGFTVFASQYIYENCLPSGEREKIDCPLSVPRNDSLAINRIATNIEQRTTNNEVNPIKVTLTAYSPDKSQTQGNPFETASGLIVTPEDLRRLKYIAVSRDLKKKYNLEWGDSVYIEFKVIDLMGEKAQGKVTENTIDIFFENEKAALDFGHQEDRKIIILGGNQ